MVDGVTSRPFSAKTLPPVAVQSSNEIRDMVIETSRNNYTRRRSEVEAEIQKWSSTVPGTTRPDGEEVEGKFKATCSNCGKDIYVPFEPEAGRPIYCKECLFKIKNGEIDAAAGFRPPREKRDNISYDALASLGIEFKAEARPPARFDRPAAPRPTLTGSGSTSAPRFVPRSAPPPLTPRPAPATIQPPAAVPTQAPIATATQVTTPTPTPPAAVKPVPAPAPAPAPVPRSAPANSPIRPPASAVRPTVPRPMPGRTTAPVRTPQDENLPPQGMIRADSRDMAIAKAMSERKAPESDVSLPNPRVVRTPIRKERKMPDTSGLQSLLKDALGGVMGNASTPRPAATSQQAPSQAEAPRPSMSLDSLKNKAPTQFITPTKEALPERQNMLKDAISLAMGERVSAVEEKVEDVKTAVASVAEDIKDVQDKTDVLQATQDEAAFNALREEQLKIEKEKEKAQAQEEQQRKESEERAERERQEEEKQAKARAEAERLEKEKAQKELEEARLKMEKEAQEKIQQEIEEEKKRLQEAEEVRKKALAEVQAKAEQERIEAERERDRLKEELRQTEIRAREVEEAKKKAREAEEARQKVERDMKELEEKEEKERLAKEEALRAIEDSRQVSPAPKAAEEPPRSKKAKEIPEDLLKQMLE